jgi:hypothetical protein
MQDGPRLEFDQVKLQLNLVIVEDGLAGSGDCGFGVEPDLPEVYKFVYT